MQICSRCGVHHRGLDWKEYQLWMNLEQKRRVPEMEAKRRAALHEAARNLIVRLAEELVDGEDVMERLKKVVENYRNTSLMIG